MPIASLSLVLGLRGSAMLIRPGWDGALSCPAIRPAVAITLPMEMALEGGFAWAPSNTDNTERYAASLRMFWPLTPEWHHLRPAAVYGWEYSGLQVDDHVRRSFGTAYGLGATWAITPHAGLRPTLVFRSDKHIDGGTCPLSPGCIVDSLLAEGRYNLIVQMDAVLTF